MLRIEIIRWGGFAARFAGGHTEARVEAVFERSIHVREGDEIICIGDASIGNGPLNAIVDAAFAASLRQVSPGMAVHFGEERGGTCCVLLVSARSAVAWTPPPAPALQSRQVQHSAIAEITRLAHETASPDGLALLALGLDHPDTALNRIAAPRVGALQAWLASDGRSAPPTDLLGLGPGLTPSGDDLLCGVLIALHARGETAKFAALGAEIRAVAPSATSLASSAMLAAAAQEQAGEPLHLVVNAIIGGTRETVGWVKPSRDWVAPRGLTQPTVLSGLVMNASQSGHTSGWDAIAGVVLAFRR